MDNKRLREGDIEDHSGVREALRLALRNLVLLRARTVVPLLVIAMLACALDFFAGFQRVLMQKEEAEAAFAQGLGQLAVVPSDGAGFASAAMAEGVRARAAATHGVALAILHAGPGDALQHLAIYVANPADEERVRADLSARLRDDDVPARVIEARFLSGPYRAARRRANAGLGAAGLAVLALAGAMSCWSATVNGKRRRRELTVMRSFGLQRRGITSHVMAEAVVVAVCAIVLATMAGSVASWLAEAFGWNLPVELDPARLAGTMAALLAVTTAAAAIPALRAAEPK